MKIDADIKKIFFLGLFIRFLFMPFAGFMQDIGNINYISHVFATGHFNIYKFLAENYGGNIMDTWAYFPLGYIMLGAFHWLFLFLLPELTWVKWVNSDYVYRALFIAKIPYLIFDIAMGWLIYSYFKNRGTDSPAHEKWPQLAFKLWWLNPVVIFTSYIFGQFDVMATFFLFFAVFVSVKYSKPYVAALLLGIGGLFKSIPMFILPFLAFSAKVKGMKKIITFIIGAGILFLGILPFISYEPFRSQILFTPHSAKIFALNFTPWGSRDTTLVFVVLNVLLFLWYTASGDEKKMNLCEVSFAFFALFFIIINFHPQYFIWIIPFAIVVSIERGYTHVLKYLYLSFFLTLIEWKFEWVYFESMAPVLTWARKPLFDVICRVYDAQQLINISRSALSGILVFFIIVVLMRKNSIYVNNPIKIGLGLRSKLIFILSLIGIVAIIFCPFNVGSEKISQQLSDSVIGIGSSPITQTFVADGQKIRKVFLDIKTANADTREKYNIAVDILDENNNVAAKSVVDTKNMKEDAWVPVSFKGGLRVEKGKVYTIRIYSEIPVKVPSLFIKFNSKDVYPHGKMIHGGINAVGDIAFRVLIQEKTKVFDEFYPRILKDKLFIMIYIVIMILIFIVILKRATPATQIKNNHGER